MGALDCRWQIALEVAAHEALIRQAYNDSVGVLTLCMGMTNATGHRLERCSANRSRSSIAWTSIRGPRLLVCKAFGCSSSSICHGSLLFDIQQVGLIYVGFGRQYGVKVELASEVTEKRRRSKEGMAKRSARPDRKTRERQSAIERGQPTWRSANSHTGPRSTALHQEADQMAAPDYADT
jgi:hypothetical protein